MTAHMMTEDVVLRPVTPDDIPALLDTAVSAWAPIFASFEDLLGVGIFDTVFPDWRSDKREQIASACLGEYGAVVLVAELAGAPVGFVSYYVDSRRGIGEISNNAVAPDYQNRGIATRLYQRAISEMREAGVTVVKVQTGGDGSHAPARRAYEKAGFVRSLPGVTYFLDLREQ